jgi:hypothetical protein
LLHLDFRILIRMISFLQKTSTFRCPQTGTKKGQLPVLQNLDAHVFTCLDSLKLHFKLFHRFKVILRCTLKFFYSTTAALDDIYTQENTKKQLNVLLNAIYHNKQTVSELKITQNCTKGSHERIS